ncbi:MAG: hypothetical protein PUJ06_08105 [Stecheria intestinalis]|nr:hypothetical protein [Stecheria intestinalis]MDY4680969.1 hypothetical protein [Lachnospiraceae bacterium]
MPKSTKIFQKFSGIVTTHNPGESKGEEKENSSAVMTDGVFHWSVSEKLCDCIRFSSLRPLFLFRFSCRSPGMTELLRTPELFSPL